MTVTDLKVQIIDQAEARRMFAILDQTPTAYEA